MQNFYKEYIDTEQALKTLENKIKELRSKILAELNKKRMDKDVTPYGTFTICKRTSWDYTDKIKKMEESIKLEKINEQEKGKAKASVTEYLKFVKDDETLSTSN
jgi:hypothetical protein